MERVNLFKMRRTSVAGGKALPGRCPIPPKMKNNPFTSRSAPPPIKPNAQPHLEEYVWVAVEEPTLATRSMWKPHPETTEKERFPIDRTMSYVLRWQNSTAGDHNGDEKTGWCSWSDFAETAKRCFRDKKSDQLT